MSMSGAFVVNQKSVLGLLLDAKQQEELLQMLTTVAPQKMEPLMELMVPIVIADVPKLYGSRLRQTAHLIAATRTCMHSLAPVSAIIQQSYCHSSRIFSFLEHALRVPTPRDVRGDCPLRYPDEKKQLAEAYQCCYDILDYQWYMRRVNGAPLSDLVMTYLCPQPFERPCPLFRSREDVDECCKIGGIPECSQQGNAFLDVAFDTALATFTAQMSPTVYIP
jgi:hypothetical protein